MQDEAKSMLQIEEYHNHIVNLQGIFFDGMENADRAPTVIK